MKTKGSINIIPQRKEEVRILYTEGFSINYIATKCKMGWDTVRRIVGATDNLDSFREEKKRKMAESLWDLAIRMKNKITDAKLTKTAATSLVIGLATAIDKALLLSGEVTGRLEVKTEKELDRELTDLGKAEKELREAWLRAQKEREKAAEGGKQISQDGTNGH